MIRANVRQGMKTVGTVLIAGFLVVFVAAGLFVGVDVDVEKRQRLVDVSSEAIKLLERGASDSAVKEAVEKSGKHVDRITELGGTLLFYAARNGRKSLARWLVEEKNARPNGIAGQNPLAQAVRRNDPEMVKLLLRSDADPTHDMGSGLTPMRIAKQLDTNAEIIEMLEQSRSGNHASEQGSVD